MNFEFEKSHSLYFKEPIDHLTRGDGEVQGGGLGCGDIYHITES